jgi:hypothetical protein
MTEKVRTGTVVDVRVYLPTLPYLPPYEQVEGVLVWKKDTHPSLRCFADDA